MKRFDNKKVEMFKFILIESIYFFLIIFASIIAAISNHNKNISPSVDLDIFSLVIMLIIFLYTLFTIVFFSLKITTLFKSKNKGDFFLGIMFSIFLLSLIIFWLILICKWCFNNFSRSSYVDSGSFVSAWFYSFISTILPTNKIFWSLLIQEIKWFFFWIMIISQFCCALIYFLHKININSIIIRKRCNQN